MIKKAMRKGLAERTLAGAKSARASAQAVRFISPMHPPPVAIEPRCLDSPAWVALKKERERLLDEIAHQELVTQDHPTTTTHQADDASDVAEQATNLALHCHLQGLLKEIERAIVRAERGTYGWCERCGKPIDAERLKIMPSASLYIERAQMQARSSKVVIQ